MVGNYHTLIMNITINTSTVLAGDGEAANVQEEINRGKILTTVD